MGLLSFLFKEVMIKGAYYLKKEWYKLPINKDKCWLKWNQCKLCQISKKCYIIATLRVLISSNFISKRKFQDLYVGKELTFPKLFGKCSISSVFSWHVPFWKISIVKQSQHPELFHMIFAKLANLLLHFWPDIFHWLTNVLWSKMRLTLIYQISVMLDNLSTLGGIEMRLMK